MEMGLPAIFFGNTLFSIISVITLIDASLFTQKKTEPKIINLALEGVEL